MSKLTAKRRNALPVRDFAGPDRSYPIENESHARDALSRVSANGTPALKARVRKKVARKYPSIKQKSFTPKYPKIARDYLSVDLRKPKSKRKLEPDPDEKGVAVYLEHHHLMKLKGADGKPIVGRLKSGHPVAFHGRGVVERSESRSTDEGERHSATLRLHHGAVEHHAEPAQSLRPSRSAPKYPKIAKEYIS